MKSDVPADGKMEIAFIFSEKCSQLIQQSKLHQ
jgi:hypothetical protein